MNLNVRHDASVIYQSLDFTFIFRLTY